MRGHTQTLNLLAYLFNKYLILLFICWFGILLCTFLYYSFPLRSTSSQFQSWSDVVEQSTIVGWWCHSSMLGWLVCMRPFAEWEPHSMTIERLLTTTLFYVLEWIRNFRCCCRWCAKSSLRTNDQNTEKRKKAAASQSNWYNVHAIQIMTNKHKNIFLSMSRSQTYIYIQFAIIPFFYFYIIYEFIVVQLNFYFLLREWALCADVASTGSRRTRISHGYGIQWKTVITWYASGIAECCVRTPHIDCIFIDVYQTTFDTIAR